MSELAYEDIKIGDEASLTRTITEVHIVNYAGLTGDMNPVHVDAEHAARSMFGERIAHGMLVAGLISAVLGTQLPGPNSIYLGQDLKFVAPVMIGDTVKVVVSGCAPSVRDEAHDRSRCFVLGLSACAVCCLDGTAPDGAAPGFVNRQARRGRSCRGTHVCHSVCRSRQTLRRPLSTGS